MGYCLRTFQNEMHPFSRQVAMRTLLTCFGFGGASTALMAFCIASFCANKSCVKGYQISAVNQVPCLSGDKISI